MRCLMGQEEFDGRLRSSVTDQQREECRRGGRQDGGQAEVPEDLWLTSAVYVLYIDAVKHLLLSLLLISYPCSRCVTAPTGV